VDVELGLRRVAREGRSLQEVRVLRVRVNGAHDPELELPVGGDDALPGEPGPGVHRAQVRPAAVGAPVLVEEVPDPEGVVAEAELGHVLRHRAGSLYPGAAPIVNAARRGVGLSGGSGGGCPRFPGLPNSPIAHRPGYPARRADQTWGASL